MRDAKNTYCRTIFSLLVTLWGLLFTGSLRVYAQEVVLDFADGLLPSAKGWIFQGQDN